MAFKILPTTLPIVRKCNYSCIACKSDTEVLPLSLAALSRFVTDGSLNPLFATEISSDCLNRNVTEQKLDLL